jgi:hypothetical protein
MRQSTWIVGLLGDRQRQREAERERNRDRNKSGVRDKGREVMIRKEKERKGNS